MGLFWFSVYLCNRSSVLCTSRRYRIGVCRVYFRSRAPINGVISGVTLEVNAKDICEKLDQVVGAHRLTRMVEGER